MVRVAFQGLGFVFVAIATIGAFLPILPTTPFLLLAAACFVRSSPNAAAWLYRSPGFGPPLKDWRDARVVRRGTKAKALGLLTISGALSVYFAGLSVGWSMLAVLPLVLIALVVIALPSERTPTAVDPLAEPVTDPPRDKNPAKKPDEIAA